MAGVDGLIGVEDDDDEEAAAAAAFDSATASIAAAAWAASLVGSVDDVFDAMVDENDVDGTNDADDELCAGTVDGTDKVGDGDGDNEADRVDADNDGACCAFVGGMLA